jgi:hypothetical protein
MALLAAVAACFKNGHAFDAGFEQGILYCIQFRWLENRFDLEHVEKPRYGIFGKRWKKIVSKNAYDSLSGWTAMWGGCVG